MECSLIKPESVSNAFLNSNLKMDKGHLTASQRSDPSFKSCVEAAIKPGKQCDARIFFMWEDDVPIRRLKDHDVEDALANYQVVLPSTYRSFLLQITHEHPLSGHLGVNKTYKRMYHYFF